MVRTILAACAVTGVAGPLHAQTLSGAQLAERSMHRRAVEAVVWGMGFRTTQLVYVAAKLGIADLLEVGPKEASALASAVGADAGALNRLMRALASLEIFAQRPDGRFELTPLARTLRSNAPGSLRDLAMLYGDDWVWDATARCFTAS